MEILPKKGNLEETLCSKSGGTGCNFKAFTVYHGGSLLNREGGEGSEGREGGEGREGSEGGKGREGGEGREGSEGRLWWRWTKW